MFDVDFLSKTSKTKLQQIKLDHNKNLPLNINLKKLLDQMMVSFSTDIDVSLNKYPNCQSLKNLFIKFNESYNGVSSSKFIADVKQMESCYTAKLKVLNDIITINFLVDKLSSSSGYIASTLHAIHTFCYTFPYHYHALVINICLDDNKRDVDWSMNVPKVFDYLRMQSAAFNVSGVTDKKDKVINLTKKEEIIKLLYHEMVHFIGLDYELINISINFGWATKPAVLNISEAYTEFMSILLYAAYQSIHLASLKKSNVYDTYARILFLETNYSVYLTSNILKFFGYDENTFRDFFKGIGKKQQSPIYIWEYVIVRTQLLLNLDKVADLVGGNDEWRIDYSKVTAIVDLMKVNNEMINRIQYDMINTKPINNISYTIIDLDWNKT